MRRVVKAARAAAASGHTLLVETLAERIAEAALTDPRVLRARVTVEKPDAFPDAASVGVVIERMRRMGRNCRARTCFGVETVHCARENGRGFAG